MLTNEGVIGNCLHDLFAWLKILHVYKASDPLLKTTIYVIMFHYNSFVSQSFPVLSSTKEHSPFPKELSEYALSTETSAAETGTFELLPTPEWRPGARLGSRQFSAAAPSSRPATKGRVERLGCRYFCFGEEGVLLLGVFMLVFVSIP